MVIRDEYRPLADDSPGCLLDDRPRKIQNGSRVYHVALKKEYLELLGICSQGEPTIHSVAVDGRVTIANPAYIIQPAEVLPDEGRDE